MWNSILRAMIESYMSTTLGAFLAIKDKINFSGGFEDVANSLGAFMMFPYIFGFPIWMAWFLRRNRFRLADPDFKGSYNSMYLNVDYFKKAGLTFQPILLFRRLFFAFNAVFMGFSGILQLGMSLYFSQMLAQYLVGVKPMID